MQISNWNVFDLNQTTLFKILNFHNR